MKAIKIDSKLVERIGSIETHRRNIAWSNTILNIKDKFHVPCITVLFYRDLTVKPRMPHFVIQVVNPYGGNR
jgi:hypothetical protein